MTTYSRQHMIVSQDETVVSSVEIDDQYLDLRLATDNTDFAISIRHGEWRPWRQRESIEKMIEALAQFNAGLQGLLDQLEE